MKTILYAGLIAIVLATVVFLAALSYFKLRSIYYGYKIKELNKQNS
jgi:hypothetical protein